MLRTERRPRRIVASFIVVQGCDPPASAELATCSMRPVSAGSDWITRASSSTEQFSFCEIRRISMPTPGGDGSAPVARSSSNDLSIAPPALPRRRLRTVRCCSSQPASTAYANPLIDPDRRSAQRQGGTGSPAGREKAARSRGLSAFAAAAEAIERDGGDDDRADEHLLDVVLDADEIAAVLEQRHQERADQ